MSEDLKKDYFYGTLVDQKKCLKAGDRLVCPGCRHIYGTMKSNVVESEVLHAEAIEFHPLQPFVNDSIMECHLCGAQLQTGSFWHGFGLWTVPRVEEKGD